MADEPAGYPVAYCAPGGRLAAALTLMFKEEHVERIVEHPYLKGSTDVLIVGEPPELLVDPEAFRIGITCT